MGGAPGLTDPRTHWMKPSKTLPRGDWVDASREAPPEQFAQGVLQHYRDSAADLAALAAGKQALAGLYDVAGIVRIVNICFWGRSGSYLLASYLDDHDDILTMPMVASLSMYTFFDRFAFLSVWDKLLVYPTYSEHKCGPDGAFFSGDSAIDESHYRAAVAALEAQHRRRGPQWLNTSQRFVQLLHVAYALALERRPANARPLIVYAQHWSDDGLAARYVADFPQGLFLHTVRDPIANLDSWFERQLWLQKAGMGTALFGRGYRIDQADRYLSPAAATIIDLLSWDRPHRGMADRSRAVRFEDMHKDLEAIMRRVAAWIGVDYQPSMLASTFNGRPHVNESGNKKWVGSNPANAARRSRNLFATDRWFAAALMREDFTDWGYAFPKLLRQGWARTLVIGVLWVLPLKMEWVGAGQLLQLQAWPALRQGRVAFALGALAHILGRRLRLMVFLAGQAAQRLRGRHETLRVL